MDAILYPYRMLATTASDDPKSVPRPTPFCSAVLLYFDSVILASAALPHECAFARDFNERETELRRRHGPKVFGEYSAFADRLTAEETLYILWRNYSTDWTIFSRQADLLLKENVVRQISLIDVINRMRSAAVQKNDSEALQYLNLPSVLHTWGFIERGDSALKQPLNSAAQEAVVRSLGQADGPAPAAALLCDLFRMRAKVKFSNRPAQEPYSVSGERLFSWTLLLSRCSLSGLIVHWFPMRSCCQTY
jgi:hypothetical protein